jgi:alpha-galactosidase
VARYEILRSTSVDVVIDVDSGVPAIVYWGPPIADPGVGVGLDAMASLFGTTRVPGSLDVSRHIPVVPMHADGFVGRPGLEGHRRGGRVWAPRFSAREQARVVDARGSVLVCRSEDPIAQLRLESHFILDDDGVLTTSAMIENIGDSPYMLDALSVSIPFPSHATELGIFTGRWVREFQLERFPWMHGAWTSENRSGRSSHEHPPFIWVFERNANESSGAVWSLHVAWSGNHTIYAERLTDGSRYIQMGELFHPGEICIDPGQTLATPDIIGVFSDHGVSDASRMYHRAVRRRSPVQERPRLVHVNTWEAVYFDHDVDRLQSLAECAAEIGVERFVLDDGWFGSRRDDTRGLGDWHVAPDVYPQGLAPLIDHVISLGMDFGIWVEPEMANPNSDVLRAHPDWILGSTGYEPILGRNQVVLDLSRPDVFEYLSESLDALLRQHPISYVKWDMNRALVQGSNIDGKASSHHQVRAVYRLIDQMRAQHPHVEFESCASGGGRIDFEMLRRVERVWTSDSNDALERQHILHGASMMFPLEILGSHIGPSPSHTTRRRHSMSFRGATALFGHLGIEADITRLDERDRADLARVIDVYKRFRSLLHSGDFVRVNGNDHPVDPRSRSALMHAVMSGDRTRALLCIAQLNTEASLVPDNVRIPGLIADAEYAVEFVPLSHGQESATRLGPAIEQPEWISESVRGRAHSFSGRFLTTIGLPRPVLWPETAIVVHISCA